MGAIDCSPMQHDPVHKPAWSAVFAMALCVAGLITAEFLPASLLTPMATDLGVSEGLAGQSVTATSIVALFASLSAAVATRRFDRRWVLLSYTALQVASNLLVAFAPNLPVLLVGRVVLGVALGGFWAMSTAAIMRLVPAVQVPRALSVIFAGVSVATVVSVPLGTYLGALVGWRAMFVFAAALGLAAFIWQVIALPSLPAAADAGLRTIVTLLRRDVIARGMAAVMLVFGGHFGFFTYLRPFLESEAHFDAAGVSMILLGFGLANLVGTSAVGWMVRRSLRWTLALVPLSMAAIAVTLATLSASAWLTAVLVSLWGFAFGTIPVAWSTWLTRTVPDQAETGGGLYVAAVQLAIALGAAGGGLAHDSAGASGTFVASALALLAAACVVLRPSARGDMSTAPALVVGKLKAPSHP
jgi:predicted MFS family arabinose efflux permease